MIMLKSRKKHSVHTMHDHTKGGLDVFDLLSTTYSTRIKSRRYPLSALAFTLDTCRSKTKTILQVNRIKLTSFEMTYNLGKKIVLLAIRKIYSQSNELKITVIKKGVFLESTRYRSTPNWEFQLSIW